MVNSLESNGLQVCYSEHVRLHPGEPEGAAGPEFVRSRWCLLEANLSLFRDCLERKPVVPVLLEPGISITMHLCHLTYLEARDPDLHTHVITCTIYTNVQMDFLF